MYRNSRAKKRADIAEAGVYPIEVVLPAFLNVARFAVLSAPPTATATPDGAGADLSIVLGPPLRQTTAAKLDPAETKENSSGQVPDSSVSGPTR